jgi:hypothetical protein
METAFIPRLETKSAKGIHVYHLPSEILTPIAVSPERLKNMSHVVHIESEDPKDIQMAYEALIAAEPVPDPETFIDARWLAVFIGHQDQELLSVYADGFGLRGVIDGNAVSFTKPSYVMWLEGRFA